jgi:hypothetical protein
MLASVADFFSRGFRPRKPKPGPLNQEPAGAGAAAGAGAGGGAGGGSFGNASPAGLMPGSPSAQRVTQKPLYLCKPFVTSQLVKGSFSTIVVLPRYVDQGEWLALNSRFLLILVLADEHHSSTKRTLWSTLIWISDSL